MDLSRLDVDGLADLLASFEDSSIGRSLRLLVELAEIGKASLSEQTPIASVADKYDPLMTPAQAAKYLGISPKTLLNSWTNRYGIESTGERKGRRFELSELNRVKELRKAQGATNGDNV